MKTYNLNRKIYAIIFLSIVVIFFSYYLFSIKKFTNDIKRDKNFIPSLKYKISKNEFVLYNTKLIQYNKNINSMIKRNFYISFTDGYPRKTYITKDGSYINLTDKARTYSRELNTHINSFNQHLQEKNIDFLYLESPDKNYFYQEELGKYNYTFNIDSYSNLYKKFKEENIKYIDTNVILDNIDIPNNQLFYKTDFHITSETARKYALYLANYLNSNYQWNLDTTLLNEDKFNKITYKNKFEGYYERLSNLSKTRYDDINYYIPNYYVEMEANYNNYYGKITGKFENVMYKDLYNVGDSFYDRQSMYQKYLYGVSPIKKITNKTVANKNKIIVIADSQFWPVSTFLSLMIKDIDIIDIRSSEGNYERDIRKYIENENPDMVLYFITVFDSKDLKKLQ